MPGRSKHLPKVGLAFAAVAVVGYLALGWRWGGDTEPVIAVVAGAAVLLAVGSELYDRL